MCALRRLCRLFQGRPSATATGAVGTRPPSLFFFFPPLSLCSVQTDDTAGEARVAAVIFNSKQLSWGSSASGTLRALTHHAARRYKPNSTALTSVQIRGRNRIHEKKSLRLCDASPRRPNTRLYSCLFQCLTNWSLRTDRKLIITAEEVDQLDLDQVLVGLCLTPDPKKIN